MPRAVEHAQLPVPELQDLAVLQGPGDLCLAAPGPEGRGDLPKGLDDVFRDAVSEHHGARELVIVGGRLGEVLHVARELVDRRYLRPRMARDDVDQPEVVHVLVGQDDQLDVVDRATVLRKLVVQLVEGAAGVRAGVDQRERVVLDQVGVHAADRERRRNPEHVDAHLGCRLSCRLGFHERMMLRISPVRASISSFVKASRLRRSSGSVLDGRTLKCQVPQSTETPSRQLTSQFA